MAELGEALLSPSLGSAPAPEGQGATGPRSNRPRRRRSIKNIMAMDVPRQGMASATDPMTSLSIHRSTLESLQELKTGAETWDMFLERLATYYEDTLTPELKTTLRARMASPRIPLGAVLRQHREIKKKGR